MGVQLVSTEIEILFVMAEAKDTALLVIEPVSRIPTCPIVQNGHCLSKKLHPRLEFLVIESTIHDRLSLPVAR